MADLVLPRPPAPGAASVVEAAAENLEPPLNPPPAPALAPEPVLVLVAADKYSLGNFRNLLF